MLAGPNRYGEQSTGAVEPQGAIELPMSSLAYWHDQGYCKMHAGRLEPDKHSIRGVRHSCAFIQGIQLNVVCNAPLSAYSGQQLVGIDDEQPRPYEAIPYSCFAPEDRISRIGVDAARRTRSATLP